MKRINRVLDFVIIALLIVNSALYIFTGDTIARIGGVILLVMCTIWATLFIVKIELENKK